MHYFPFTTVYISTGKSGGEAVIPSCRMRRPLRYSSLCSVSKFTTRQVVDAICKNTPVTDNNGTVPAGYKPVITSITVIDKPEMAE